MSGILGVEEYTESTSSQLIAGNTFEMKKITIASGAGVLKRGTVLGMDTSSYKYKQLNPGASDGTEVARAILVDDVDASSNDIIAMAYLIGKYKLSDLIWPDSITDDQKRAALLQLQDRGIIVDDNWA